ncbi:glycosyltransferase, partial [Rosenbergiella epipactidis]|uniref:glycosyltransferase n=1 Tax=Rosenbergiella epipactidis TaxID=1544694 RepID=UPI001F4E8175
MVNIKFSVLMSLYKNEKSEYLSSCLESLANQTVKPTEIIVVIDGPISEELYKVIKDFKYILPIIIKPLDKNVGLGKALNYGLGFCNYNYIARMDTDDICLPERFEKQLEYMISNPKVSLLGSSIIEFDKNYEREKNLPVDNVDIIKFAKWKNPFNHMSVFFKKEDVIKLGGYKHHLYMEDYNLWLRIIDAGLLT